MFKILYFLSK